MNLYAARNESKVPTISGTAEPNVNNMDRMLYYESNSVPFTIVLDTRDAANAAQRCTHVFIEGENIGTYSVIGTTISAKSLTKSYTDGFYTRRVDIDDIGRATAESSLSVVINTKLHAANPIRIFRCYALDHLFNLPVDRCFRDIDWQQADNKQHYEDIYGRRSTINPIRLAPQSTSFFARFRAESERQNLINIYNNLPEFLFEYDFNTLPNEIYLAEFDSAPSTAYTTQYTGSGSIFG